MPGLVPGIHEFLHKEEGVDGRDKPGHDEQWEMTMAGALMPRALPGVQGSRFGR